MPKCDFNKVAKQLYWNHISAWAFFCTHAAYSQNTCTQKNLWRTASETKLAKLKIFINIDGVRKKPLEKKPSLKGQS